jgi:hypothetical protein
MFWRIYPARGHQVVCDFWNHHVRAIELDAVRLIFSSAKESARRTKDVITIFSSARVA